MEKYAEKFYSAVKIEKREKNEGNIRDRVAFLYNTPGNITLARRIKK